MVDTVFSFLMDGVTAVFNWFDELLNVTEMYPIVIGIIVLCIFFRLIVTPLFAGHIAGAGQSDSVSVLSHDQAEAQRAYESIPISKEFR